jgi:hypothetical protein
MGSPPSSPSSSQSARGTPWPPLLFVIHLEPFLVRLEAVLTGLRVANIREASLGYMDDVQVLGDDLQDIVRVDLACRDFEALLNRNRKTTLIGLCPLQGLVHCPPPSFGQLSLLPWTDGPSHLPPSPGGRFPLGWLLSEAGFNECHAKRSACGLGLSCPQTSNLILQQNFRQENNKGLLFTMSWSCQLCPCSCSRLSQEMLPL